MHLESELASVYNGGLIIRSKQKNPLVLGKDSSARDTEAFMSVGQAPITS